MARIESPIQSYLDALHASCRADDSGAVADYIPELATKDPSHFGICLATMDGHVYETGDSRIPFTIQSISKPFTYGLALGDHSLAEVAMKVGVEPSGDAFNSISLESETGRPLNPMINAGAITASSLVGDTSTGAALDRLLSAYGAYAGRELIVDSSVYASEKATGHRNRAIAHMLRNFGIVTGDPETALDLYFTQCSVEVDCRDLSLMAATLANGGVHPVTGSRVLSAELVTHVLSVMTTCGMYDGAGEWVVGIGLPAKSGVGGGILAVLPGQLGLATYSPRLDRVGNSARGVRVCERMSKELGLHFLEGVRSSLASIRSRYDLSTVRSRRRRPPDEVRLLEEVGDRCAVFELQGDLVFAGIETLVREIVERSDATDVVIVDFSAAARTKDCTTWLLEELAACLRAQDKELVIVERVEDGLDGTIWAGLAFTQRDAALEWAEGVLLGRLGLSSLPGRRIELHQHPFCEGLDADEISLLRAQMTSRTFVPGELLVHVGDLAQDLWVILEGEVSVFIEPAVGRTERLATLGAGMLFGESALVGHGGVRSASIGAETGGELLALASTSFDAMLHAAPGLTSKVLRNVLRATNEVVNRLNREVTTLSAR